MDAYIITKEVEITIGGEVMTLLTDMPADWSEDECYEYAVAMVYDSISIEVH